jgi:hypothetical protein
MNSGGAESLLSSLPQYPGNSLLTYTVWRHVNRWRFADLTLSVPLHAA